MKWIIKDKQCKIACRLIDILKAGLYDTLLCFVLIHGTYLWNNNPRFINVKPCERLNELSKTSNAKYCVHTGIYTKSTLLGFLLIHGIYLWNSSKQQQTRF